MVRVPGLISHWRNLPAGVCLIIMYQQLDFCITEVLKATKNVTHFSRTLFSGTCSHDLVPGFGLMCCVLRQLTLHKECSSEVQGDERRHSSPRASFRVYAFFQVGHCWLLGDKLMFSRCSDGESGSGFGYVWFSYVYFKSVYP